MSDEVREATVNENQKLAAPEEQITKPAPKVKHRGKKTPRKSPPGKSWQKKTDKQKPL